MITTAVDIKWQWMKNHHQGFLMRENISFI